MQVFWWSAASHPDAQGVFVYYFINPKIPGLEIGDNPLKPEDSTLLNSQTLAAACTHITIGV